jgi:hypothetical protein
MSSFDPFAVDPTPDEQCLAEAARRLAAVSGALGTIVWLWDETVEALQAVACFNMADEYLAYGRQCARLPVAKSIAPIYITYRTGVRYQADNPIARAEYRFFSAGFEDYPITYVMTVPIGLGAERVGALALYFERPTELTEAQHLSLDLECTELAALCLGIGARRALSNAQDELAQAGTHAAEHLADRHRFDTLREQVAGAAEPPIAELVACSTRLEETMDETHPAIAHEHATRTREEAQRLQTWREDLPDEAR